MCWSVPHALFYACIFFFKQKTAYEMRISDWSSDVCSSDLADRAAGTLKPLSGVPIGMKDLFATNRVQTTAASHMLEGFVPRYESTVSAKLWDAGAGMLGTLTLDQFAMGSSNETSHLCTEISTWPRKDAGNGQRTTDGLTGVGDPLTRVRVPTA